MTRHPRARHLEMLLLTCLLAAAFVGCAEEDPPRPAGGAGGALGGGGTGGGGNPLRCTEALDFGRILVGAEAGGEIVCANDGEGTLQVEPGRIDGDHPDLFSAEGGAVEIPAGGATHLGIAFAGTRTAGRKTAMLSLNVDGREAAAIALRAEVIDSPVALQDGCASGGLDFGYVQVGESVERLLRLHNRLPEPVEIRAIQLPPSFRVVTPLPLALPPADPAGGPQATGIAIAFEPTTEGKQGGEAIVEMGAGGTYFATACVKGVGGGPVLRCESDALDFGSTSQDMAVERRVRCTNAGTDLPAEPIADNLFVSIELESEDFVAKVVDESGAPGPAAAGYAAGEGFDLVVTFRPAGTDRREASLVVRGGGNAGEHAISLSGEGQLLPPCELDVLPAAIDFGHVPAGRSATLDLGLRNRTGEACLIRNLRLADEGDAAAFSIEVGYEAIDLAPGASARIPVRFHAPENPGAIRSYEAKLTFDLSHPEPAREVLLEATSGEACIRVLPEVTTFAQATPECAASRRTLEVINGCETAITIDEIRIAAGPGCESPGEDCVFELAAPPALPPGPLRPGYRHAFEVVHTGAAAGHSAVQVDVEGHEAPYFAQLVAEGQWTSLRTDVFEAPSTSKVDVLWVVDDSSAFNSQLAAGEALPAFLTPTLARDIDFQLAITTMNVDWAEKGRIVPLEPGPDEPRIFTPWTPDLHDRWKATIHLGTTGSAAEQGLEAARLALSPGIIDVVDVADTPEVNDGSLGFLRPDAALAIVFVGWDEDQSPSGVDEYVRFFRERKHDPDLVQLHGWLGICGAPVTRYRQAIEATGGILHNLCGQNLHEYVTQANAVFSEIGEAIFVDQHLFRLSGRPVCGGTCDEAITVLANGETRLPRSKTHLGWAWDPQRNAIVFPANGMPSAGSRVEITYEVACDDET